MRFRLKSIGLAMLLVSSTVIALAPTLSGLAQPEISQSQKLEAAGEANHLLQQGIEQFRQAQYPAAEAAFKQAVDLYRQTKNREGEAKALLQLGEVYNWSSQPQLALTTLQTGLTLWRDLKNRHGEGRTLHQIGEAHNNASDRSKALEVLQQAIAIQREIGDHVGEGRTLFSIGKITALNAGQLKPGLEALKQAQAILQKTDDRVWESLAWTWIGVITIGAGNPAEGLTNLQKGLEMSRQAGDRGAELVALRFTAEMYNWVGVTYYKQAQYPQAMDAFQQALSHFQKVSNQPRVAQVWVSIADTHREQKQYLKAVEAYQQAIAIYRQLKNDNAVASAQSWIGVAYYQTGQYPQALEAYQQSLALYQKINNQPSVAQLWVNIADTHFQQKQYFKAVEVNQQALAIYKVLKNDTAIADVQNRIGSAYDNAQQYSQAIAAYQQALATYPKTEANQAGIAQVWMNIAGVHNRQKESPKAVAAYQQALAIYQQLKNDKAVADVQSWIGVSYYQAGQYPQALAAHQQSLASYQKINNQPSVAQVWVNISDTHFQQKQYPKSVEALQQALTIYQQLKNDIGIGDVQNRIGNVFFQMEQYSKAVEAYQQALATYKQSKNESGVADVQKRIGFSYYKAKQYPQALQAYQQALKLYQATNHPEAVAQTWRNVGNTYYEAKQYPQALEAYQQTLKLYQAANRSEAVAQAWLDIGYTHDQQKQYPRALEAYQKALEAYQKALLGYQSSGDRINSIAVFKKIAATYRQIKQPDTAIKTYQQALELHQKMQTTQSQVDFATVGEIYNRIGVIYDDDLENYSEAIAAYQKSLENYEKTSNYSAELPLVWSNLGSSYRNAKQYSNALEAYQKALASYQSLGDRAKSIDMLKELAVTYRQFKQPDTAIKTYYQALELHQRTQTEALSQSDIATLGEIYNRIGVIYSSDLEKYTEAIAVRQKSIAAYQETSNQAAEIAQVWSNLGNDYYNLQQYSKAVEAYQKALENYRQIHDQASEARVWSDLSSTYRQLGQTDKAAQAYQQARRRNEAVIKSQSDETVSTRQRLNLSGIWQINPDEKGNTPLYTGTVAISRAKERYGLQWKTSVGNRSGIALEEDKQLFVGWSEGTTSDNGLIVYSIGKDGSLNGEWIEGISGTGTERATGGKPGQLEGDYIVTGINYDGTKYKGKLKIQKLGEVYQLFWETGTEYQGVGIRVGNLFVVGWGSSSVPRVATYEVQADRLIGRLAIFDQPELTTEILVRNQAATRLEQQRIEILRLQKEAEDLWEEGQSQAVISKYQQAVSIAKILREPMLEASLLRSIAATYHVQEQFLEALKYNELALKIYREIDDSREVASTLNSIGVVYSRQGQYDNSLDFYRQALALARTLKESNLEGSILTNIGKIHTAQGDYPKALKLLEQALTIHRIRANRVGEGVTLDTIGLVYTEQGNYQKALEIYQQALVVYDKAGQSGYAGITKRNIGSVHVSQGNYQKALASYEESLQKIRSRLRKSRADEAATLSSIGQVNSNLGLFEKSLEFYQKALSVYQELGYRASEGKVLSTMGRAYSDLKQYSKALSLYQQGLTITRSIGDLNGESEALYGLGRLYIQQSRPQEALEVLQQALSIQQKIGIRPKEAATLSQIGHVQTQLDESTEAQTYLQRSLIVSQQIGDQPTTAQALANLGALFAKQNQPEVAIVFYKQSVNVYEDIRGGLRTLPKDQQESYTQTVTTTYRSLADLLIQQGRLPEAQAVLELLKLQELRDFTRNAGIDSPGINLANIEQTALTAILSKFNTIAKFIEQIESCEKTRCPELKTLLEQRDHLNKAINAELNQQRAILAKYFSTESATLTPEKLNAEARRIVNAQPGTVLIYPLVLKDKLQFLLALKAGDGAVTFRPVEVPNVSAETLFKTIQTFREQLSTPSNLAALQATSQTLYTWLIKPLEPELSHSNIKHLVFAPDSTIRYIPLAALYDGKHYLIERYSISTITAASQTDTTETFASLSKSPSFLLAMGASKFANADPLDNVPAELDAIVQASNIKDSHGIYPGSEFLNTQFDFDALRENLKKKYRILHIATHGKFQPGRPEDSYLIPGRGNNITTANITTLADYGLSNIHLVVLSACETAVGDRASDGIEIPGISHYFLSQAKSVLASLWSVNDASTALMMQQFYKQLATSKITKAEALQAVQNQFIQSKLTAKDAPNRAGARLYSPGQPTVDSFAHPYYWAPFILIGNGL